MWIEDDEYIIRCGCGDSSHPVWLGFEAWHFEGVEHQELNIQMHIDDDGFWGRLKNAVFYLFKNRKFWHYGCVSLDLNVPRENEEIRGLVKFLNSCLGMAKKAKSGDTR